MNRDTGLVAGMSKDARESRHTGLVAGDSWDTGLVARESRNAGLVARESRESGWISNSVEICLFLQK